MEDFEQVVISDRYPAYNLFSSEQRQICWAHLKRDFTRISQHEDKLIAKIGKGLLGCEAKLFHHWHRFKRSEITREELLRETKPNRRAVGEYLEQGSYTAPELRAARFCKNLLNSYTSLWMFLTEEGVEPTNNLAEQCLRYLVIWRKKYFGTQSNYGSEYVARTASLITTARLQKENPFRYLTQAITCSFSGIEVPSLLPA
jgi:transposase